jgi:hypothetical protein
MMILTRKLVSAAFSVLLSLSCSVSNAQSVSTTGTQDLATGNLLQSGAGSWTNTVPGSAGGLSGGQQPAYNALTDTIIFGYTQATTSQTIPGNLGLQGTGIQVIGYNYSWKINNADMNTGSLSANVSLKNSGGSVVESFNYTYSDRTSGLAENFQLFTGTQNFSQIYPLETIGAMTVSFTGKDDRFWAGYYGPRVREPSITANYRVDPCVSNPAVGPQCPGFNELMTSINLVPYPNAVATQYNYIDNTYPIATVLSNSGSGLQLHGFKYGFVYDLKEQYCSQFLLIFCLGYSDSVARVSAGATTSTGGLVFNNNHVFQGVNTGPQEMSYQYLFPQSTNTSLMGNFHFSAQVEGNGSIYNMYSKMIVTPDPCTTNPYYSPTCTGFQEAIDKLNGTNKTDYATTGYTEPASVTAGTASPTSITYTSSPTGSTVELAPPTTTTSSITSTPVSSTTSVSSATPTASNPTPRVGEVQQAGSTKPTATISTSQILNMISSESTRVTNVEKTVTATAELQAKADALKVTEQAELVAATAVLNSTSSILQAAPSSGTGLRVNSASFAPVAVQSMGVDQRISAISSLSFVPTASQVVSSVALSSTNNSAQTNVYKFAEQEQVKFEQQKPISSANPLQEYMNNRTHLDMTMQTTTQTTTTVKKNVQDNEAAGGVTIASIATQPVGYELYMGKLADGTFYAPKEIYKNQKTVDNARAQRMLSGASDRLHEQMIQQQYKGN